MSDLIDFEVRNRWTNAVQFVAKIAADPSAPYGVRLGLAVRWGVANKANLAGAYLAGANLADADLARANLADANLAGANLAGANLADANLADANLGRANLARANLAGANLADANLARANLAGANLAGANLADAYLAGAYLARAYLADADLARANLADANLAGADLARALVKGEKVACVIARLHREIDPYAFTALALEAGGYKVLAGCRWFTDAEFRAHVAKEYPDTEKATETLAILDYIAARAVALGVSEPVEQAA